MTAHEAPIDMRDAFFSKLVTLARSNPEVVILTADHSALSLQELWQENFPRLINMGIAEQNMVGVAAGLALAGKKVFIYGITPFVSLRVLEHISLDLAAMQLPVTIISIGAGFTYSTDGPSHHGVQDIAAIQSVANITLLNSSTPSNTVAFLDYAMQNKGPSYIRIEKGILPDSDFHDDVNLSHGWQARVPAPEETLIFSSGYMVHKCVEVAENLAKQGIRAKVVDVYRLSPFPKEAIRKMLEKSRYVITVEENFLVSGLGDKVYLSSVNSNSHFKFLAIGVKHDYIYEYGSRDDIHGKCGLDTTSVTQKILQWIKDND